MSLVLEGKPTPLPLPENAFPDGGPTRAAYDECLALEQCGTWNILDTDLQKEAPKYIMFDMSPPVAARILGHALLLAPTETGHDALAREINNYHSDPEFLAGLAHLYAFGLLRVFYNPKGPTPGDSADQSTGQSLGDVVKNLEHLLQQPSIASSQLRKLLLFRDNRRCVFTNALDSEPDNFIPGVRIDVLHVARVISQSLSADICGTTERVREKFEWARTAGAVIESFGGFSSHDVLRQEVLNSPSNAFLSTSAPHEAFDQLDMWLTPAEDEHHQTIPNTYDVGYYWGKDELVNLGIGVSPRITFRSTQVGTQTIPPPDSRIIALHAACARIAHMSGAAGYLQEFFRDNDDDILVMTEPNVASELSRALKQVQMRARLVSA